MDRRIHRLSSRHIMLVIVISCPFLFLGCEGPSAVDAVPRTSQFKPVFGIEEAEDVVIKSTNNTIDTSFLHEDHFACVRFNPAKIVNHADFKDIQWQDLQDQIAELVGVENSRFENVKSVWLVMDQSTFSTIGQANEANGPPFLTVIDYFEPFNKQEIQQLASSDANEGRTVESISETRLAVGRADAIAKLKNGSTTSALATLVAEWDENSATQGAIAIAPIRSLLVSIFDMVSQIGPEAKKFANLPDAVQYIQLNVRLEDSDEGEPLLLEGYIAIEDDDLAREIVKSISDLGNGGSLTPMAGMMGGMQGRPTAAEMMFTPSTTNAIEQFGREIKDNDLFSVRNEAGKISFRLLRPDSFKDTIAATVADGKKQLEIMQRAQNLDRIAKAIKAYEAKYDCLPSMTAISIEESATIGLPPQFSWRVAILPFLGLQDLHDRFAFDKPWDANENLEVARDMPEVFGSSTDDAKTAFQLAAGKDCIYRADRTRPKLSDISDKKIWTALVIEVGSTLAQNWIRPNILDLEDASTEDLGQEDENGILFVNAAFATRALKKDNELIRKVLTCDGDETMTRRDFIRMNIPDQK